MEELKIEKEKVRNFFFSVLHVLHVKREIHHVGLFFPDGRNVGTTTFTPGMSKFIKPFNL